MQSSNTDRNVLDSVFSELAHSLCLVKSVYLSAPLEVFEMSFTELAGLKITNYKYFLKEIGKHIFTYYGLDT